MPQVRLPDNKGSVQIQQTIETMEACLMYLYQAHLNQGLSDPAAKAEVAQTLVGIAEHWQATTGLEFRPGTVINPLRLLDQIIETTAVEARTSPAVSRAKWQTVHRKLVDLRAMAKKEGGS